MKQNFKKVKTLIIAEAGVNHNGDLKIAKELIHKAAYAGADCVKFQTFTADTLVTPHAPKADYQLDPNEPNASSYEMLKNLELSKNDYPELIKECKKYNIEFFSTAFDEASLSFLLKLGMSKIKIPSGEITNKPLLEFIAQFNLPVIMSTGMADLDEIECSINVLTRQGLKKENLTILHCTSQYPAEIKDINLRSIVTMKEKFGINIGYSDHTLGSEASIAAVSLGARIIEKHITLNQTMPGPDHKASMEPDDFKAMIMAIRNIENGLGDGQKAPTKSELEMRLVARKSLVANKAIKKGELLTKDNLTVKRPGCGISPMRIDEIIGTKSKYSFQVNDLIKV
jgi:N,N'-diacetyllegionaminate synthase